MSLLQLLPWSLRGINPFLNTYGDKALFGSVLKTKAMQSNPRAKTTVHSAVPHRYLYAYLYAIKSLLQYDNDFAVCVHDDGSLTQEDIQIIKTHIINARVIERKFADEEFDRQINNPFLSKVRSSYTSYLKLFDTTLFNQSEQIIILDTDTLFLKKPIEIIDWSKNGGPAFYHMAPKGKMKENKEKELSQYSDLQKVHIQTLIINDLDDINQTLQSNYYIEQGFCSGFIGYQADTINFNELEQLFKLLHDKFGDKVFRWGAEQTTHGLLLCSSGAQALPIKDYFVFTQNNAPKAKGATFVHFVGENRFHKLIYPKLAREINHQLTA